MADQSDAAADISLNIKGPSELKLTLTIASDQTVRQLKESIQREKDNFPADAQRLIYAGKVLKDDEPLATYKIKPGHTVHMVRSASRSAPSTGNPQTNAPASATAASSSSTTTGNSAQAQGVPSNFSAGQNFNNDSLSILNRADYAGPHMARLLNESGGAFGQMGLNPRDPNMMMGMMQNPEVQRQMRDMLSRPEFVDMLISQQPQLQAMAPQMREMMRSEQFREMITNPETMQRMAQMQQMFGGGGGGAGGGLGGLGGLGGFGGAAGAGAGAGGAAQFPPPGAFGSPTAASQQQQQQHGADAAGVTAGGANPALPNMDLLSSLMGLGAGNGGGAAGAGGQQPPNPFAAMGGFGGGAGAGGQGAAGGNPFGDPALLQQLLGGLGGGGAGGAAAAPRDTRPPEERFATQLEQMQAMGFYDGTSNVRALLMSGGSVEGAIGILLDNPNPPLTGGQ